MPDDKSERTLLIKQVAELFDISGATDLEFQGGGFSLRLKRGGSTSPSVELSTTGARLIDATGKSSDAAKSVQPPIANKELHTIVSGMAGTFFRSPSPEKDPFVALGDTVSIGQTICLVEAMKMLNEIEADRQGIIVEILPDDGATIGAGAPLFVIEVGNV
ncbi:acetyl-CoA carboxylase biotin carboxyl carrier protein [Paraburkholderia sabiae]|uniref:Biotin carboxyl carrier protein of acetyl-CoA carboxylase n=1 Tax=Paraburkholderia sabiae TaxID=273251 RepID=A0ABU9QM05_9BURK|nr:acetyl-CoA carboxylase biotin carboxyl carrier protein [Paraburkholderia sabiae]WJZ79257.1 acetyl-CoA carboxylase biotin carboxyl carrier protein [Paraburkholderia sabiae]CAD6560753.1 Biotin carboxyl carrier protein of acetyl-CoA carboxylase [Paraburkholderia sabiae]